MLLDFIGPLGLPSHIRKLDGTVVLVGGGLGVAPVYPQLREYKNMGNRTVSIVGFRNRDLVFWEDLFREFSDELIVTTDDGSYGRKGFVTHALADVLANEKDIREVVAIGPIPMMKACCGDDPAVRHPDGREPEFDHGGWHGDVRIVPRDGGRRHEIRLRGRRGFRRPPGEFRRAGAAPEALRARREGRAGALPRRIGDAGRPSSAGRSRRRSRFRPASCRSRWPQAARAAGAQEPQEHSAGARRPCRTSRRRSGIHNFKEVALGLDLEGALHEAERCMRCKKPRCVPGCPVGIDIPGFIAALAT